MKPVCSICNAAVSKQLLRQGAGASANYSVYFCEKCRVGITEPFPSEEELSRLYASGSYRSSDGTRFLFFIESIVRYFSSRKRKRIEAYSKKGDILDIGCGRGLFLAQMKKEGWNVKGIEFNQETASYAGNVYGVPVITAGELEALPSESFDAITINHVLEHMSRPGHTIAECRRMLRKNGLLMIAVPNLSSLQARLGKAAWFHLDLPCHLHHFTSEGLLLLLRKNSFTVIVSRHFDLEQNMFGWLQTLFNMSGIEHNLLYGLLKKAELRQEQSRGSRTWNILLTLALLPIYGPLSVILSLAEAFFLKQGGTVAVYAVKQ